MATTYKKLSSYFLNRGPSTGGTGYYYGNDENAGPMPEDFDAIKVDLDFNPDANDSVAFTALQPDGKILIGGSFTTVGGVTRNRIARLNSDGSLDTSFDPNLNASVNTIVLQPDGKILIGGGFTTVGDVNTRNRIARLNSDGSLDTSFNPNANSAVYTIAIQPDGKILIGGQFTTVGGVTRNRIARLNSDGSLDTGFNPNVSGTVWSVAIQPDGKIIVGGEFITVGGVSKTFIARLNSDGSLDTSFNASANFIVACIALQPDEKIIISGYFNMVNGLGRERLARLNSDGSLDTSFNNNVFIGSYIRWTAIQPDGKILIGGTITKINGITRNRIARLNSDGTLDTNFAPSTNSTVSHITVQPDGKIIVGGYFTAVNAILRNNIFMLKEVVSNAPYRLAYTVPENTQVIVKNIFATNHNDFPVFHDIAILPLADENEGLSQKHYYVWDNLIQENDYEVIDSGITLSAGDEIYVYSSTDEDISYNIFGVEITQ